MMYCNRKDKEMNKKSKKKDKPHFSIRCIVYGLISSTFIGGLMYVFRGIMEPHEAIKLVEFGTVTMLIFEHVV